VLFWILLSLQIIAGVVAGEASIRKTPEGAATLEKLSKAGLFFLRWRASANYRHELLGLQKFFLIGFFIFGALFFVLGEFAVKTPLLTLTAGTFMFLWMGTQFITERKNSVRGLMFAVGVYAILPWTLFLFDYMTGFQFHFVHFFVAQIKFLLIQFPGHLISSIGINKFSDLFIIFMLSIFGLFAGMFGAILIILFLPIVPLFFLFLMASSSKISKYALMKVTSQYAYNLAVWYSLLISPTLIALEAKGIIYIK
jgi:hypothetical protein